MDKSDHILDTQIEDAEEWDRGIIIHLSYIQFLAEWSFKRMTEHQFRHAAEGKIFLKHFTIAFYFYRQM